MRKPVLPDPALAAAAPFGSREIARFLRRAPILVALSGGADSTALLHGLVRLRASLGVKPPYGLAAAHLNHRIRGAAADADAAFCKDLCKSLGVPLRLGSADVPAAAVASGESLEMAARRLRHDFLRRAAAATGAEAIATGHTLDDQVELFLLRLSRGASLRGLACMPPLSPSPRGGVPVLRPLLGARHAALCGFLRAEGLAWREDATNAQDDALRNRIRHHAVPALIAACGPSFPKTLARTAAQLRDDADCLDALAAQASDDAPAPLARRRIAARLYDAGIDPEAVTFAAIERLRALLLSGRRGTLRIGAATVRAERGELFVGTADEAGPAPDGTPFVFPGSVRTDGTAVDPEKRLSAEPARTIERPRRGAFLADTAVCTVAAAALAGRRLVLRTWRAGDRIAVAGGRGTRKLSDIFTDAKLPREDRARIRLLADAATGEVLWLPGHGVARSCAAKEDEPMLRLVLETDSSGRS